MGLKRGERRRRSWTRRSMKLLIGTEKEREKADV
jgi:hypothetical protein